MQSRHPISGLPMKAGYIERKYEEFYPTKKELDEMFPGNITPEQPIPFELTPEAEVDAKRLKKREIDRRRYHAKKAGTYKPSKFGPKPTKAEETFWSGLPKGAAQVIKGGVSRQESGLLVGTGSTGKAMAEELQSAYANGREAGKHEAITDMITFLKNQLKLIK